MTKSKVLCLSAGLLFAAGTAWADDPAPPDPNAGGAGATVGAGAGAAGGAPAAAGAAGDAAAAPKIWVGGGLEVSPLGSFSSGSQSTDSDLNYGLDVVALYAVTPMISVGVAPRFVLNVKGKNAMGDAAKMYDLRAVGAFNKEMAPKINIMALGGLGYSSIMIPDQAGMSQPSASGLTVSFAGGAGYALSPKMMATAMVNYELGFQSVSVAGQSADLHFNHLFIGLGILAAVK